MKKFTLLLLILLPFSGFCQAVPTNVRSQFAIDQLSRSNFSRPDNAIIGIPVPPGRTIGDTYADSKWNIGSVMIANKNTLVEGYLMKYDVKGQVIEIRSAAGIRLLEVRNVAHMVWIDSLTQQPRFFVSASRYKEDGAPLVGLLEVLADGNRTLFRKTYLETKSPTYNIALDAGSRDTEILKKSAFYYNVGEDLVQIKTKKKFLAGLGEHRADVEAYMKEHDLDVKKSDELSKIFAFYNSKLPASNQ